MYGKSRKQHEITVFFYFDDLSLKTVYLTIAIAMLPEIVHKILFNVCNFKETPMKDTVFFISMINFHSSSPKTDCRNEDATSKLW